MGTLTFCPAIPCYNPHTGGGGGIASWLNHSSFSLQSVMFYSALPYILFAFKVLVQANFDMSNLLISKTPLVSK